MCHCGAVVIDKELLARVNRVRLPATLFSVSLYRFFFLFGLFILPLFFLLAFFSLFLLLTVLVMHLEKGLFWKRDFKSS